MPMPVPTQVRTARMLLRPWCDQDAPALAPVLAASAAELARWTPAQATGAAPLEVLVQRLAAFSGLFAAGREWRYGLFDRAGGQVLGEVSLFPRDSLRRVTLVESDRVEIGYWVRSDRAGQGLATEAAYAALRVAAGLGRFALAEIRCDSRNLASAAIPRRLGFVLSRSHSQGPGTLPRTDTDLQVWELSMASQGRPDPEQQAHPLR